MGTARYDRLIRRHSNIAEVNPGYLRRLDLYHGESTDRCQSD